MSSDCGPKTSFGSGGKRSGGGVGELMHPRVLYERSRTLPPPPPPDLLCLKSSRHQYTTSTIRYLFSSLTLLTVCLSFCPPPPPPPPPPGWIYSVSGLPDINIIPQQSVTCFFPTLSLSLSLSSRSLSLSLSIYIYIYKPTKYYRETECPLRRSE